LQDNPSIKYPTLQTCDRGAKAVFEFLEKHERRSVWETITKPSSGGGQSRNRKANNILMFIYVN
jgi:hypothetical protein